MRGLLLFVGEAPSQRVTMGPSGSRGRLARLLDVPADQLPWTNLLEDVQPSVGKGNGFDAEAGHRAASRLLATADEPTLVLLGRRVAAAFDLAVPYLTWHWREGKRLGVIPHPSGINRWYNDGENAAAAAAFIQSVCWTAQLDRG